MKLLIIILLLCVPLKLLAPVNKAFYIGVLKPVNPYEKLWDAVKALESSNNPFAINYLEGAFGISQIRQIKLDWYFNQTGKRYILVDCFDVEVSREIFMYHCCQYPDLESSAKAWNGSGPLTIIYWGKIKKHII